VSRILSILATVALLAVAACSPQVKTAAKPAPVRLASAHLTVAQLQKLAGGADPAALGLSASLPINAVPAPDSVQALGARAEQINAARPFADDPIRPMRPFILKTDAADQARALHCLAQAIYFEAAREPLKGQQAVAQVVLNRVRHPAYPKTVCGVVYQGASLPTGCQFTFTCDGALRFRPEPDLFARAEGVAKKALAGYVDADVGSATHYHAAYVAPYWAPTLVKMTQVGQHIFYRWTGTWGEPAAFTGRYGGHEAMLTPAVLTSQAPVAAAPEPRQVTLASLGGEARTYKVLDPGTAPNPQTAGAQASGGSDRPVGALYASRRKPTPDEIRQINAKLAAVEARLNGTTTVAQAAPAPAAAGTD